MKLTSEQVHLFRHNGFLKLKDRLPEEQAKRLRKAIWRNIREEVEPAVRDSEGRIIRLSGVVDRDPVFLQTATCPARHWIPWNPFWVPTSNSSKTGTTTPRSAWPLRTGRRECTATSGSGPERSSRLSSIWRKRPWITDAHWSYPGPTISRASAAACTTNHGPWISWTRPCPRQCPKAACSSSTAWSCTASGRIKRTAPG